MIDKLKVDERYSFAPIDIYFYWINIINRGGDKGNRGPRTKAAAFQWINSREEVLDRYGSLMLSKNLITSFLEDKGDSFTLTMKILQQHEMQKEDYPPPNDRKTIN